MFIIIRIDSFVFCCCRVFWLRVRMPVYPSYSSWFYFPLCFAPPTSVKSHRIKLRPFRPYTHSPHTHTGSSHFFQNIKAFVPKLYESLSLSTLNERGNKVHFNHYHSQYVYVLLWEEKKLFSPRFENKKRKPETKRASLSLSLSFNWI